MQESSAFFLLYHETKHFHFLLLGLVYKMIVREYTSPKKKNIHIYEEIKSHIIT